MGIMGVIRHLAEKATGTRIYRVLPFGVDLSQDIARVLPNVRIDTIFDIGANLGQSAIACLQEFPGAHIHSFEPVSDTYRQLQANVAGHARVTCYQLAFGSTNRKGEMVLEGTSDLFFLRDRSKERPLNSDIPTESVDIVTLDEFCRTTGIERISFLKIDTEGGDLEVLKGAVHMLAGQKIDLVQVEAGMNPGNSRHVPLESLKSFLESHGYFIFGIYEQAQEWPTREPKLRRTNTVFASQRIIGMNLKPVRPTT